MQTRGAGQGLAKIESFLKKLLKFQSLPPPKNLKITKYVFQGLARFIFLKSSFLFIGC